MKNKFQEAENSFQTNQKRMSLLHFNNKKSLKKIKLQQHDPFELISKNISKRNHKLKSLQLNQASVFETHNFQLPIKRRHNRAISQLNITVTSRSQRKLLQFINPQVSKPIKISVFKKPSNPLLHNLSQLLKDQQKFSKFRQTYFSSLQKLKNKLSTNKINEQLPQIKLLGWKVKGYVIKEKLILKGVKQRNGKFERYRKFNYTQEIMSKVKNDYKQFIKNWLYMQRLVQ